MQVSVACLGVNVRATKLISAMRRNQWDPHPFKRGAALVNQGSKLPLSFSYHHLTLLPATDAPEF